MADQLTDQLAPPMGLPLEVPPMKAVAFPDLLDIAQRLADAWIHASADHDSLVSVVDLLNDLTDYVHGESSVAGSVGWDANAALLDHLPKVERYMPSEGEVILTVIAQNKLVEGGVYRLGGKASMPFGIFHWGGFICLRAGASELSTGIEWDQAKPKSFLHVRVDPLAPESYLKQILTQLNAMANQPDDQVIVDAVTPDA